MITTEQYLALSALSYSDLSDLKGLSLGEILKRADKNSNIIKDYKNDQGGVNPQFLAIKEIGSYKLISVSTSKEALYLDYNYMTNEFITRDSGFYAAVFQSPSGDIIFAFRGTNDTTDWSTDAGIGFGCPPKDIPQFGCAVKFVARVLREHGPVCHEDPKDCLKDIGKSNFGKKVAFTGHSLGGGLAQYMTYLSSDLSSGISGAKSITFNAVGIGSSLRVSKEEAAKYNVTDHVNSLDWVGMYGIQLGRTIRHIDCSDPDYSKVNFNALGKMLAVRLRFNKGNINALDYKRQINNITKTITNGSDGYTVVDTMAIYIGYDKVGGSYGSGLFNTSMHGLDRFLRDDPSKPGLQYKMAETVAGQELSVSNLRDLFNLINAFQVIERAKIEKNYTTDVLDKPPLPTTMSQDGVTYYNPIIKPGSSPYAYSYNHSQIAYANYIVQQFERRLASGEFMKSYVDMQKAQAEQNRRIDPLVFDLGGDGITTVSLEESNAFFDLDNNGFAEKTSWVGAKEGLLAYDKNGDGIINGGNELFGDRTLMKDGKTLASSGFTALAEYDNNKDGKIDSNDAIYTLLRIWQDSDGDGIASASELKQLVDLGIVSIGLSYNNTGVTDGANNIQVRTGTFTLADGSSRTLGEYLLNRNPVHSVDSSPIEISDDVALLPNVQGAGNVGSLHKAIMQDKSGSLRSLVEKFIAEKDVAKREALTEGILAHWAGVDSVDPKSRGDAFDARKLAVLEKFFGAEFQGSPNTSSAPLLKSSYTKLFEVVYVSLISQAQLKDIVNSVADDNDEISFEKAKQAIDAAIAQDPVAGSGLLGEFARAMKYYGLKSSKEFAVLRGYYAGKSAEYGRIIDFAGEQVLRGTANGELLSVGDLYTLIDGDSGNDLLEGGNGNDTLVGGTGNDRLEGGEGNDTYIFSKGDGVDTVVDTSGIDTIQFGEGISPDDIVAKVVQDSSYVNLELSIKGTDDKITVRQHFGYNYYSYEETPSYQVEKITFADGTTWDSKTIHDKAHNMSGTESGDTYYASDQSAIIFRGLGGNDFITGSIANDLLYGDAGNDTLEGNAGNDTLVGGTGNDRLEGGEGNDTYIFSKGDGEDRIFDANGLADEVRLGHESIDVVFERVNSSLRVRMPGSLDAITIDSWYNGDAYKIETFKSTDGNVITHTQIESLIQAMASFQNDTGMAWEQALSEQPSQVRSIVQEYWTVPTV